MDMLAMEFPPGSFDVVLDKATMDVLQVDTEDPWNPQESVLARCRSYCENVVKVLKPGGRLVQISFQQPHFRKPLLMDWGIGWTYRVETVDGGVLPYFLFCLETSSKPVDMGCSCVSQTNASFMRDDVEVYNLEESRKKDPSESDPGSFHLDVFTREMQLQEFETSSNELVRIAEARAGPFKFDTDLSPAPPALDRLPNGCLYIGQKDEEGLRSGKGCFLWADGSKYIGNWRKNRANGKGRLIHADGDMYEGDWEDDEAHGEGKYVHFNGAKYEGHWLHDKQEGLGEESWPDGSSYKGEYRNGLKNGKGEFRWVDKSSYFGEFQDNNINGRGKYTWADGRTYEGDWKNNQMHGEGVFTWPDGREYRGHYVHDKKEGWGKFTWASGKQYEGYWKAGKHHGDGALTEPGGKTIRGKWDKGEIVKVE